MSNIKRMYGIGFLRSFYLFGGVLIPMLTVWGGISFTTILLLQSLFMFCVNIFEIPTGLVADVYGRKVSMFCGLLAVTVGFIVYTIQPKLVYFIVGEIMLALGFSLISGSDKALLYDTLVDHKLEHTADSVQARYRSWQMVGLLISTPLGSVLGYTVNVVLPMQITAVATGIAALCVVLLKEPLSNLEEPSEKGYKWKSLLDGLRIIRHDPKLIVLSIDLISTTVLARPMIWLYQPLLAYHEFPLWSYGFVHAGSVVVEILVMNNARILDKITGGRFATLRTTSTLSAIGFALSVWSILGKGSAWGPTLGLFGIMMVIGFGLSREPLYAKLINERIPSRRRTTTLSTISMFTSFGSFILNPITGVGTSISFILPFFSYGLLLMLKQTLFNIHRDK